MDQRCPVCLGRIIGYSALTLGRYTAWRVQETYRCEAGHVWENWTCQPLQVVKPKGNPKGLTEGK